MILTTLLISISGIVTFALLDYLWLAKVMKSFYLTQLSSHIKIVNGGLVPFFPAIPFVYILAIFAILLYVLPGSTLWIDALKKGTLLGFILYAFYNITNLAVLKDYSIPVTIIDSLWGAFIIGLVSVVMFFVSQVLG